MKKRRTAKRRTTPKAPKVKRLKLKPDVVLVVEVPKDIRPLIVPHPAKNAVEIVPVAVKPGKPWWRSLW